MQSETDKELRRIRIVLVIMAILILFAGGNKTVTIENDPDNISSDPNSYQSNLVPLGNGYFGLLTSDTVNVEKTIRVYFFDQNKRDLIFVKEKDLNEIEEVLED